MPTVRILGIFLLLCICLGGCKSPDKGGEENEESEAGSEVTQIKITADNLVDVYVDHRLELLAKERIPAVLAADESSKARLLCDTARQRILFMAQNDHLAAVESASPLVETVCTEDVAAYVITEFLSELEGAGGDQSVLDQRCETGAIAMGYIYEHKVKAPETLEKKEKIFAICPHLKAQWEMVEKSGQKPPGAGGFDPPGKERPPGMPPPSELLEHEHGLVPPGQPGDKHHDEKQPHKDGDGAAPDGEAPPAD